MLEIQKQNHKDLYGSPILLMQTILYLNAPVHATHKTKSSLVILVPWGKEQIQL